MEKDQSLLIKMLSREYLVHNKYPYFYINNKKGEKNDNKTRHSLSNK